MHKNKKRKVPKSPQTPTQPSWNPDGFFLQNAKQRHERLMALLALQNTNQIYQVQNQSQGARSNWGWFVGVLIGVIAFTFMFVYTVLENWPTP